MEGNHSEHENSCFYLGDPSFHKAHERFTINLVTAIINIVTVPVGVIANLLIVTAIFGCPRLRTPSNLLIASLALSDLFVSLTVQLGYITYRLLENQLRLVPCFVRIMYHLAFFSCFGVSFMTLGAVSYERFVAVQWFLLFDTSCEICSDHMDPKYFVNCSKMDFYWIRSRKHPSHGMVSLLSRFCSYADWRFVRRANTAWTSPAATPRRWKSPETTRGQAREKHIYPRRSVLDFELSCVVHFNIWSIIETKLTN